MVNYIDKKKFNYSKDRTIRDNLLERGVGRNKQALIKYMVHAGGSMQQLINRSTKVKNIVIDTVKVNDFYVFSENPCP